MTLKQRVFVPALYSIPEKGVQTLVWAVLAGRRLQPHPSRLKSRRIKFCRMD
jgi:hypothetical protein